MLLKILPQAQGYFPHTNLILFGASWGLLCTFAVFVVYWRPYGWFIYLKVKCYISGWVNSPVWNPLADRKEGRKLTY